MNIHDPDVVFTDLGLTILGSVLAWRLWKTAGHGALARRGVIIMAGLASAALWGAIYHAFFPGDTGTRAGFIAWVPVSLSILLVAGTLLALALPLLAPRLSSALRRTMVALYALAFAAVVLFVDQSYTTIVRFYAPALLLFLLAAALHAARARSTGWWWIAIAIALSIVAAVLQQLGVALHPVYFDHNAVYHVVQGIALVLLYFGFRRAAGPDQATRI